MYFDPDWIFENKPEKNQYPNITGLMNDKPKKPKKQKAEPLTSLADVFSPRVEPVDKIKSIANPQIQNEIEYPDRSSRVKRSVQNAGNVYPGGFRDEYRQIIGDKKDSYENLMSAGDLNNGFRLTDNKYNMRNNLWVDNAMVSEIQKVAKAGELTPEQTLLLAAISSNEDEFGQTRNLFGINDIYKDFGDPTLMQPDSYEANQYRKNYSGDMHQDLAGYVKRKTDDFSNIEGWNSKFAIDKKINPRGERYTDRILRHAEVLLSNPQFIKALFGDNAPQFDLSQYQNK